jgi:hypothetical protein
MLEITCSGLGMKIVTLPGRFSLYTRSMSLNVE